MSHFYSVISGQAGTATRCGSKSSGVMAVAASWRGSIRVHLWHGDDGKDYFQVWQEPWHGQGITECLADGVIATRQND